MSGETGPEVGGDVVAEAWAGKPGLITLPQGRVLLRAAQWAKLDRHQLAEMIVSFGKAESILDLTQEGFEAVMDRFVAAGFRDPSVPMVTAAQLACLDESRRQLGLDGRQYVAVLRRITGVRSRRHLDGVGFMRVWHLFQKSGARVPIPNPGFMCRRTMGLILQAAYTSQMTADTLTVWRMSLGGVPHLGWLDERGFFRMLAVFDRLGVPTKAPPPIAVASPGMATQAQVNLIWKLWSDIARLGDDYGAPDALPALMREPGPRALINGLTLRGARDVIDRLLAPIIRARLAQEAPGGRPDGDRPQDQKNHDDKQRAKRGRRRDRRGRR